MVVPLTSVLAADALAGYFVAARQFIRILPAAAILAATAMDRSGPAAIVLCALLAAISVRQIVVFFSAPHENWDAAARVLAEQRREGACLAVAPPDDAFLYAFFYPELASTDCHSPRMMLAVTPYATIEQRQKGIAILTSQGFKQQQERVVGRSAILFFGRLP